MRCEVKKWDVTVPWNIQHQAQYSMQTLFQTSNENTPAESYWPMQLRTIPDISWLNGSSKQRLLYLSDIYPIKNAKDKKRQIEQN